MDYGNLAYKEEYYIPEYEQKPQKKTAPPKKHKVNKAIYIKYISAIIVLAVAAGFMISTFVALNETKSEIKELEAQLADEEAITSQKSLDLEHIMDLATIEALATSELGMKRPDKYQYVYVNVNREDVTEITASDTEKHGKRFFRTVKDITSNIVEFFSIQ